MSDHVTGRSVTGASDGHTAANGLRSRLMTESATSQAETTAQSPFYMVVAWGITSAAANVVDEAVRAALSGAERTVVYPFDRLALVGLPYSGAAREVYGALRYIKETQYPGSLQFLMSPSWPATDDWYGYRTGGWEDINAVTRARLERSGPN